MIIWLVAFTLKDWTVVLQYIENERRIQTEIGNFLFFMQLYFALWKKKPFQCNLYVNTLLKEISSRKLTARKINKWHNLWLVSLRDFFVVVVILQLGVDWIVLRRQISMLTINYTHVNFGDNILMFVHFHQWHHSNNQFWF